MNLIQRLNRDEEIKELKAIYKKKYGKPASPYCIDIDGGIEKYKQRLREMIDGTYVYKESQWVEYFRRQREKEAALKEKENK
ncbi:hypothetical protein KQI85_07265 [Falcatimonas sp. MSJ-15]|uniref:hypothetical protein n=1 Tax=Falcatimonas sp. MSJ-15 TaxID=2841515 RepID=UPI001C108CA1|nr:hypothetical protein [Falcatimonas sp. MSJ-15]MBU5470167.1 hypothetical protein [Falcatimonas sp. MSJ-15]